MEKKKLILLIGSNGNLGYAIKNKLKKKTYHKKFAFKKDIDLEKLSSIPKYLKKINPKYIINAAAYTNVDKAEKNMKLCYQINALAPKKIADWAYKNESVLIHFSTDYIFNGKNKKPLTEKNKTQPTNFYGKSKLDGEKFIINSKCKYFILRISWLYSERKRNFPQKVIKKIMNKSKIFIVNDQLGTPTHVDFVSDITLKILEKIIINPNINSNIFHISPKGYISYYNWAKKIHQKLTKYKKCKIIPISLEQIQSGAKRPKNSVFNSSKIEKFLDYKIPNWEKTFQKKIGKIIKNCIT